MKLPQDIASLHTLLRECFAKLAVLEAENAALRTENAEFCSRLGMDSGNSNKAPSSDGYKKKSVKPTIP